MKLFKQDLVQASSRLIEYIKNVEYVHFVNELLDKKPSKELTEKVKNHVYISALVQEVYFCGTCNIPAETAKLLFNHNILPVRVIIEETNAIKMRGNSISFTEWFARYYEEVEQSNPVENYQYQIWDTDL